MLSILHEEKPELGVLEAYFRVPPHWGEDDVKSLEAWVKEEMKEVYQRAFFPEEMIKVEMKECGSATYIVACFPLRGLDKEEQRDVYKALHTLTWRVAEAYLKRV